MILALILANCFILVYSSIKNIKHGLVFDHVLLFSAGSFYYWIVPIIIGLLGGYQKMPGMSLWYKYFQRMDNETILIYLKICLFFALAFYFGSYIGGKIKLRDIKMEFDKVLINFIWIPSVLLSFFYILKFRNDFFKGYLAGVNDEKGTFVAVSIILLFCALTYQIIKLKKNKENYNLNNIYTAYYIFISLLILSLGGRLYFISSAIMYLVLYTVYIRKVHINIKTILFVILPIIFLLAYFTLFRLGVTSASFYQISFYFFTESIFTSFSSVSFFSKNLIPDFSAPIFLISDFSNLIPTAINPEKADLIVGVDKYFYVVSPLGAFNNLVSFLANFGIYISAFLFFIIGLSLSLLKNKESIFSILLYIMICGFFSFTFFRDPFSISIVKCIFEFSFIIPLFVIISFTIFNFILKNNVK